MHATNQRCVKHEEETGIIEKGRIVEMFTFRAVTSLIQFLTFWPQAGRHTSRTMAVFWLKIAIATTLIYGALSTTYVNLARLNYEIEPSAFQSSTGFNGYANLSIDGNVGKNYREYSCTHTAAGDNQPFWVLNFGRPVTFTHVIVHNRADCCTARFTDIEVRVYGKGQDPEDASAGTRVATYNAVTPPERIIEIAVNNGEYATEALYLRIGFITPGASSQKFLTMCEVEVFNCN